MLVNAVFQRFVMWVEFFSELPDVSKGFFSVS